ncbi:MAG: 4-(cytidine 5'-diphospho)-2-C-methyl-D-erythritol kinase, partial [Sphingobium sp.]
DGDGLRAEARADGALTLAIEGAFAGELGNGDDNLVLRAARALQAAAGVGRGASILLDKALPIASGIGGGSADAAAALRLLVRLWHLDDREIDLFAIAQSLGADVPVCLDSRTAFGTGIGEQLEPVDPGVGGMPILLVNPLLPCPTGPVFRGWDGFDRGVLALESWRHGRNDLQASAGALLPVIADILADLSSLPGVTVSRMSGSGATCFAMFEYTGARDDAETAIRAAHPGWWTLGSVIR